MAMSRRQEREGTKLSEAARFAFSSSGANFAFIKTLCWERGEPRTGALEQNGNGTKRHAGESDRATNIQKINARTNIIVCVGSILWPCIASKREEES